MEETKIILFSTHCPKCKVIELKLKKLGIKFTIIDDPETVVNVGKHNGILTAPILLVGEEFLDFTAAVKYLNERK